MAVGGTRVPLGDSSVVLMPMIEARTSGVALSRNAEGVLGRGLISANWGIGSVVQSGHPVEEFTFESGIPHRYSFTVSREMPVIGGATGLENKLRRLRPP